MVKEFIDLCAQACIYREEFFRELVSGQKTVYATNLIEALKPTDYIATAVLLQS